MAGETEWKWRGEVLATAEGCRANQVWPLFQDYFNLHKYHPFLDTCYGIEGVSGQPGCVRYCESARVSNHENIVIWVHEKLLSIDPEAKSLTYEITQNNAMFESLLVTMKLMSAKDGGEREACNLSLSFVTNPVQGWTFKQLMHIYLGAVKDIAEKVADHFRADEA